MGRGGGTATLHAAAVTGEPPTDLDVSVAQALTPTWAPTSHTGSSAVELPAGLSSGRGTGVPSLDQMAMQEPFTEARLLTATEVADLMRVSRMTVYRLIKSGEMPSLRVGKGYRFREEDVHDYLRGRYTEAG
jgi:excisionase family DNA binding protein